MIRNLADAVASQKVKHFADWEALRHGYPLRVLANPRKGVTFIGDAYREDPIWFPLPAGIPAPRPSL